MNNRAVFSVADGDADEDTVVNDIVDDDRFSFIIIVDADGTSPSVDLFYRSIALHCRSSTVQHSTVQYRTVFRHQSRCRRSEQ